MLHTLKAVLRRNYETTDGTRATTIDLIELGVALDDNYSILGGSEPKVNLAYYLSDIDMTYLGRQFTDIFGSETWRNEFARLAE
ncbi:MAG: hypothetical protein ABH864_03125 [archaeon]